MCVRPDGRGHGRTDGEDCGAFESGEAPRGTADPVSAGGPGGFIAAGSRGDEFGVRRGLHGRGSGGEAGALGPGKGIC